MAKGDTHGFTVFIPRELIRNSNARDEHWSDRSGPTASLRQLAQPYVRHIPRMPRARVDVTVSYPDGRSRDVYNLYPTMKAFIDGLVNGLPEYDVVMVNGKPKRKRKAPREEFGFLPDDNDKYLSGPHMEWSGRPSRYTGRMGRFQFDLLITELEPRPAA